MKYLIIIKALFAVLLVLSIGINTAVTAEELPNPYKLDLRKANEREFKEAVAYGSTLGVTIVVYSAQEAPWKLSLDAANLLAKDGITVIVARANDRDDNHQDAEIVFFAHKKGRDKWTISTTWKNMFYGGMKHAGDYIKIRDAALKVHKEYFKQGS